MSAAPRSVACPTPNHRSRPARWGRPRRASVLAATLVGALAGVIGGLGLGLLAPAAAASDALGLVPAAAAPRRIALPVPPRSVDRLTAEEESEAPQP